MIVRKSDIFVGTTLPGTATGAAGIIDSFRELLKTMHARRAHNPHSDNEAVQRLERSTSCRKPGHQVKDEAQRRKELLL